SAQVNAFGADDVSLNWLRLDHVGSLVRCSIRDIYVGSNQIHAPAELVLEAPLRLLDWIEQYAVTFAWAPNFALGLINKELGAASQREWDLSSLRSMLSVAEAIIPKTAQTFVRLLAPHGFKREMMHAAWGMSETCAAVTFSHDYLDRLPSEEYPYVEVGAPTAGFRMRIVDGLDRVVSEGTVGRLQIKGPMVMAGYYENTELNASEFTADGWFKTGDLGYIKEGRLTVTGREKDIIIINGLNHSCPEIEAIVEEVDGVLPSYTAACGLRQAGQDTDQLLVFFCRQAVEPDELKALLKNIQSALARKLGVQASHLLPVEAAEIPKTSAGKIQRLKLKDLFEARAFDDRIKSVDRLLENQRTLPDWFFKPCWQRQQAALLQSLPVSSHVLVFCDGEGFGEALAEALKAQGHHCATVEPADGFVKLAGARFAIAPDAPDDYQKLIAEAYPSRLPDVIVHCWLYQPSVNSIASTHDLDAVQSVGACSLFHIVQTLARSATPDQPLLRLQVVSTYGQLVDGVDTVLDYAKSPILGLIKTIPRELAWMDCRHLDLEFGPLSENVDAVLEELCVPQPEREVALRKSGRFVPRIAPFNWEKETPSSLPFKKDRFYLITGGLGGVGFELAQYLLQYQGANVLLVGRSSLEDSGSSSLGELRRQRLEILQALDGHVDYVVADVDDCLTMERWVEEFSQRWQMPLGGIIHLAGVAPERLIVDETWESMSAALRAKVAGTWVLHQLVKDRPDCLFVSMSSVISLVGGSTVGAYSASNMFLNHFQQHARLAGHAQHYCFCSSTWSQIGVNQGYSGQQARQAQGQVAMSATAGLQSVLVGLRYRLNELVFGLDRRKPAVQRMCRDGLLWNQQPVAYLQSTLGDQELQRVMRPACGRVERLARLPVGPDGRVDRVSLMGMASARKGQGVPQTPAEKKLADIWQAVLGLSAVGRDDNFFELGGTSVQAARLFIEMEQAMGMMLPLASLFQAPTIAQLARLTEQGESDLGLWNSLVPIREEGDRPPLFFIHAGFGDVVGFESFDRYLDHGWPIYALRPEDLGGQCEPLRTIEEMAA
ncbi:SDR family NAD(P)-dependent oxidoreductase, partial [Pontiella sp.]|uniref:SDR family NAD(P)-dependent oxidoreductase n=1 Tax=Pontiella sp. TaxID=2837462 RepID=UPI00356A6D20